MASTTPTKLNSLPAEIIKRIASFSPTTSILALFLVNRHLRNVCNDEMIFKAIISNRNNEDNQYIRADEEDDWSPPTAKTEHARYALADLKAREWRYLPHNWIKCEGTEADSTINMCSAEDYEKANRWAPKLASLHHPFINSLSIVACLDMVLLTRSESARLGMKFVLTNALLAQMHTGSFRKETFDNYQRIKNQYQLSPDPLDHKPWIGLIALSIFLFNGRTISIPLPSPSKIPFPANFLPIPFSDITTKDLNTSHLPEMTSKHYLEQGEWVGYYSYGSDLSHSQVPFDPPMTGIHFTVVPNTSAEMSIITADGRDKVGTFRLEGTISLTGEIKCRKIYDTGSWWWDWNAKMTPFGIVGNWGRNQAWDQDGQGCVWLWKREWSE